MKMRKVFAALLAVLMLCSIIPFAVAADGNSATIDFTNKANRTAYSSSQQVWEQNGIIVTNDKGASTSNVGDYANPGRFYKSSTVTIEYPGMTKIVIDSVTYTDNDYAAGWVDSIEDDNATATVVDGDVTIMFSSPVNSFVWEKLTAQSRAYTITVYTGDTGDAPVVPPVEPDPPVIPDGTELTIADAIAMGQTYAHNTFSESKYYVTGVITEIYNDMYGNMKLADEAGNILTIYGTWSEDGSTRFDAMGVKPVVGDSVVLYGIIGQYNGTSQMKNGWIIGIIGGDTPDEPDEPDTPDTPDQPAGSLGVVTNPVEGVAYKLGLNQTEKGAVYYFTGAMSGYYGATDTSVDNAVDMYVEMVSGGYKLYFNNGSKQYIKLEQSGTHYNFTFGATGSVFTLDADLNAFCAPCGDSICYMGTYGTYVTVGCLTEEKLKEGDYIARLYGAEGETPDTPVDPEPDTPDTPDTPDEPDEPDYDDEIDTTIPYLLGMIQENISTEDVYFLDGGMNGYYMTTTTDEEEAIWVYLEKTNGGYYLYALDEDDAKVYINMAVNGTHVNGVYEYTASTVYNYDWDLYTLVAEVNGDIYAFGTRNDKTYTTMGPVKVSYNGFHADLYYFTDEGDCEHEYESEVIDPTCGEDGATVYTCIYCGYAYDETIPATGEHTYDDEYDADCNACGAVRDVPEKPVEYVGTVEVSTATGAAGETVNVTVTLPNNPGIVSAKVKVYFDTTVLNFVAYTDGEFAPGGYSTSDPDLANQNGYFIINWCDALHPDSTANLLATLSFEILAGTQEGSYALVVEIRCDDDVFNAADETVWFSPVDGAVIVVNGLPGDADGNGKINNRDLGLLQMYLNDDDLTGKNFNEAAVDLDGNGKLNNRDLGLLQKLLNQ